MDRRIALRYAKAVFNLAKQQKEEDTLQKELLLFSQTIEPNSDLETALASPLIKPSQKLNILKEIFTDMHQISEGLFEVLAKNGRVSLLVHIAKQYQVLYDFEKLTDTAVVTTAIDIDEDFSNALLQKIEKLAGKKIKMEHKIDPEIIGGFTLRLGDMQYDASINTKLKNLQQLFENSHFTAKI